LEREETRRKGISAGRKFKGWRRRGRTTQLEGVGERNEASPTHHNTFKGKGRGNQGRSWGRSKKNAAKFAAEPKKAGLLILSEKKNRGGSGV